jgi:hypothetical protein
LNIWKLLSRPAGTGQCEKSQKLESEKPKQKGLPDPEIRAGLFARLRARQCWRGEALSES